MVAAARKEQKPRAVAHGEERRLPLRYTLPKYRTEPLTVEAGAGTDVRGVSLPPPSCMIPQPGRAPVGRVRPRAFDLVGSVGRGSVPAWPAICGRVAVLQTGGHGGAKH
jgi:hypothetical protein